MKKGQIVRMRFFSGTHWFIVSRYDRKKKQWFALPLDGKSPHPWEYSVKNIEKEDIIR